MVRSEVAPDCIVDASCKLNSSIELINWIAEGNEGETDVGEMSEKGSR